MTTADESLLSISPLELMLLWGDLVEAFHKVHVSGGSVAQIYAYRLVPYSMTLHSEEEQREEWVRARKRLYALVKLFCDTYQCEALIDGVAGNMITPDTPEPAPARIKPLHWRAEVKIIKIERYNADGTTKPIP